MNSGRCIKFKVASMRVTPRAFFSSLYQSPKGTNGLLWKKEVTGTALVIMAIQKNLEWNSQRLFRAREGWLEGPRQNSVAQNPGN